ncbi:ferric iron uptake transcriptional regulator [Aliidiomarina haloalkalitolerans]|uniref:Ferric uptake regulation protein n=1 Tax=Aliidiomarina haloalkalitolerans TaxID=859059 RepID=A0A432VYY6_9GAMM|nr:ferric iron uptake transcriptional regulator [Aliidiomarina haloalkalitolerans]MCL4410087.1 ferric iron uptake transcriptional regulator [Gammaproteobacteria bacterium]RUO21894.1 ferric iron uptake transcriptional regulator [Aliidiomarina haloalkalitolerans]
MSNADVQLKKAGLKVTSPRIKILEVMKNPAHQHVSAEEVFKILLEQGDEVGLATVYRVLNQFDDAGIVTRHHFEGGRSVFELSAKDHHDHLVCLDCGRVIEFEDDTIEKRQLAVAKEHGLSLTNHSLYLYGECKNADTCDYNREDAEHHRIEL